MNGLLSRAQHNDPEAFVELIKQNEQDLYKVAKGYFREEEDVADVMQETILSCYENIGKLREPKYFKTWLIKILINKCNDLKKSRKRYADVEDITVWGYEDQRLKHVEFMTLLDSLDEKYRMILLLHYGAGFKVREISDMTGWSMDSVKGRLKQGRRKLKIVYENDKREALA